VATHLLSVLAGFSQGGAIALQTGLRHSEALGGIVALSTYLPLADLIDAELAAANRAVPIWMAHGSLDPGASVVICAAVANQAVVNADASHTIG
jgi:phospholipase/carboxylesterase